MTTGDIWFFLRGLKQMETLQLRMPGVLICRKHQKQRPTVAHAAQGVAGYVSRVSVGGYLAVPGISVCGCDF